jgi:hypothetical protein
MKQSTVGEGRQLNPLRGNSTRFAATQPASRLEDLGLKNAKPLKVK